MIISASLQVSIAMTEFEMRECNAAFCNEERTKIAHLSGRWLIREISWCVSGDTVLPWIVDLNLLAVSIEACVV